MKKPSLSNLRKNYLKYSLNEIDVSKDPFMQFERWFLEASNGQYSEANAMILATTGNDGKPSARTVLLKSIENKNFIFFTNYKSKKGRQLSENPNAALLFLWQQQERQVRIEGIVKKASKLISDSYFDSRPYGNKLGAVISEQSSVISGRDYIDNLKKQAEEIFTNKTLKRPAYWGGYSLKPLLFEFWQGRTDRLHDRIQYTKKRGYWKMERLAP